jgi:hypothetical protein
VTLRLVFTVLAAIVAALVASFLLRSAMALLDLLVLFLAVGTALAALKLLSSGKQRHRSGP